MIKPGQFIFLIALVIFPVIVLQAQQREMIIRIAEL